MKGRLLKSVWLDKTELLYQPIVSGETAREAVMTDWFFEEESNPSGFSEPINGCLIGGCLIRSMA